MTIASPSRNRQPRPITIGSPLAHNSNCLAIGPCSADVDQAKNPGVCTMVGERSPCDEETDQRISNNRPDPCLFDYSPVVTAGARRSLSDDRRGGDRSHSVTIHTLCVAVKPRKAGKKVPSMVISSLLWTVWRLGAFHPRRPPKGSFPTLKVPGTNDQPHSVMVRASGECRKPLCCVPTPRAQLRKPG